MNYTLMTKVTVKSKLPSCIAIRSKEFRYYSSE